MHLFTIPTWVFVANAIAAALLAAWKGGWPERAVAAVLLVEWVTENDVILRLSLPFWYQSAWDVVILATCVTCALRTNRYWTLAASSFALLEVVTYALLLVPGPGKWAWESMQRVWTVLIYVALLLGVRSAGRSRKPPAAVSV